MTGRVCEPRTEQVQADTPAVPVTAPEGQVITGWCVKAGSANQGLGLEEVVLPAPVTAATITHSSGKDVSHYVLRLSPAPTTTTPAPSTTISATSTVVVTTTAPEPSTTSSAPTEPTTTVVVVDSTFPAQTTVAETAPPPVSVPTTLPETGSALTGAVGLIGAWALAVGALLVWLGRCKHR